MPKLFFFISFFILQNTIGQVTFVIESTPKNTKENNSIYISGDFEEWTGGQEKYELLNEKGVYSITLPKQVGSIQFKFTQGSWDLVESDVKGNSIENRTYTFGDKPETINLTIEGWFKNKPKPSTASKNVSILSENFFIPQLNRRRKIWLYLPPDYKTSKKKYPVIYMHDGQNLFDDATSFSGEWQVDETLDKLFEEKGFGAIVIGIENDGMKRLDEYSPWVHKKYGGGEGEQYVDFIVETLKPYVDKNYRTKSDANNTAIIGSSMGGLISFYAVLKYPSVFGMGGIFSPSFWFSDESFEFAKTNGNLSDTKLYFLAGDNESKTMVSNLDKMIELMTVNGFNKENIKSKIVIEGEHNEKLWRENFEEAIRWLFEIE